jgi:hypothetical protein
MLPFHCNAHSTADRRPLWSLARTHTSDCGQRYRCWHLVQAALHPTYVYYTAPGKTSRTSLPGKAAQPAGLKQGDPTNNWPPSEQIELPLLCPSQLWCSPTRESPEHVPSLSIKPRIFCACRPTPFLTKLPVSHPLLPLRPPPLESWLPAPC